MVPEFIIADVHVTLVQDPIIPTPGFSVTALAVPTKNNAHKPTFRLGKIQGGKNMRKSGNLFNGIMPKIIVPLD